MSLKMSAWGQKLKKEMNGRTEALKSWNYFMAKEHPVGELFLKACFLEKKLF